MIWIHTYNNESELYEGMTQRLFRHMDTTRFVQCPPKVTNLPPIIRLYKSIILKERFSLSIPGGETGRKILDFWTEKHALDKRWKKTHFYQTNEFFTHFNRTIHKQQFSDHKLFEINRIDNSQIHPIESHICRIKIIANYSRNLPTSRGIQYNADNFFAAQPVTQTFDSPFHCSIIDIDPHSPGASWKKASLYNISDSPYMISSLTFGHGVHITATRECIKSVPRLILLILDKPQHDNAHKERFNATAIGKFISSFADHPNIHIFTNIPGLKESLESQSPDNFDELLKVMR